MAADKTLVQGAYKAAGGGRPSDSAAAFDALDQINSTVNELIVKPEQKRRSDAKANAKKMADEILANGGSLNSQTFDALYPQVQNLQEQYYQAVLAKDDQAAAKIMMQMNQMSTSIQSGKETHSLYTILKLSMSLVSMLTVIQLIMFLLKMKMEL
jgi:hypothetical protein